MRPYFRRIECSNTWSSDFYHFFLTAVKFRVPFAARKHTATHLTVFSLTPKSFWICQFVVSPIQASSSQLFLIHGQINAKAFALVFYF